MFSKSYYWLYAITALVFELQSNLIKTQEIAGADDPNRLYLLMNEHGERHGNDGSPSDIEARRRSAALDSNFIRFGRSNSRHEYYDQPKRTPGEGDNFMRFGKSDPNFIRFGRTNKMVIPNRESRYAYIDDNRGEKEDSFIRFGKRRDFDFYDDMYDSEIGGVKSRLKRSTDENSERQRSTDNKHDKDIKNLGSDLGRSTRDGNFMRFGRNDNFMRFGRRNDKSDNDKKCLICGLNPYLNPFSSKFQALSNWPPISRDYSDYQFSTDGVNNKYLDGIRLG